VKPLNQHQRLANAIREWLGLGPLYHRTAENEEFSGTLYPDTATMPDNWFKPIAAGTDTRDEWRDAKTKQARAAKKGTEWLDLPVRMK
jgi:hypothetical protein